MTASILVVSNGYGEDVIGAKIIEKIEKQNNDINFYVLPIVGAGDSYKSLDIELIGPTKELPSGGFARNSFKNFFNDFKAGLMGLIFNQVNILRKYRNKVDLIIVVGDVYNLFLTGVFSRKKVIFLPTAKSEYINGHYWIEKFIIKKLTKIVFPRDEKTAKNLQKSGINARFEGNMMMDCFEIQNVDFELDNNSKTIGLLPGSREEAYDNMLYFLKIIKTIEMGMKTDKIEYITAMAGNLDLNKLKNKINLTEWSWSEPASAQKNSGIYLLIKSPSGKSEVKIIYHHFGDVLANADMFIGQAGTANEQAAGMGKPVVIFPGKGAQFTEKFAKAQKSLLGDSVMLVKRDKEKIVDSVIKVLNNNKLYNKMSQTGKKRMGEPGGAKKLAEIIVGEYLG